MKDFILAALPWIAIGLTIVVSLTDMNRKKMNKDRKDDDYVTSGLCFGMGIGIAIGTSLKDRLGDNAFSIGMSVGMLIGTIIGTKIKR